MTDRDSTLLDLLVEWEDRRAAGTPAVPEELCRERPELLSDFERLVWQVTQLDPLLSVHLDDANPPSSPAIPGFEILGEVGRGGMGTVYRARDLSLDRTVAIKRPHAAAAVSRRRFEREVRVLARLCDSPHIVPIYSAGLVGEEPYFVMGFVAGGNLAEKQSALVNRPERAATFFEQVARAVEYAHRAGVLHRDLKPSNILVTAEGEPRISDFGVAALLAGDPVAAPRGDLSAGDGTGETQTTRTGATAGTPAYCAPETFLNPPGRLTPASDVWSLGVIMYEVLAGRLPFPGSNEGEIRAGVTAATPPRPRTLNGHVPGGLEAIVLKCLGKSPTDRYPTAGAVADALARWRRRRARLRAVVRFCLTAAALLVFAAVAVAVLRPPSPEARHAKRSLAVAEQLRRGEAVTLVPTAGAPLTHRVRLGEADTHTSIASDGTFTAAAGRMSLIEFLSDPGIDGYRILAEVRENGFLGDAAFGVYFSHQVFDHPDGGVHVFGLLQFSDYGPLAVQYLPPDAPSGTPAQSLCSLDHRCVLAPVLTGRDWSSCSGPNRPYLPPDPTAPLPGPWRPLVVEVRPELLRASFAGLELKDYPTFLAQPWADGLPQKRPRLAGRTVTVSPRGGLGLYVAGGEASVRNFRIEPLNP